MFKKILKNCFLFVSSILCFFIYNNANAVKYSIHVDDWLNVREYPQTTADILGRLYNGDIVDVSEVCNGWGKVNFNGTNSAWISLKFANLLLQKENNFQGIVCVEDALMLRSQPNTSSIILDRLSNGTCLEITETKDNWGKTTYGRNSGWVCLKYVTDIFTFTENFSTLTSAVSPVKPFTSVVTQNYRGINHKGVDIGSLWHKKIDIFAIKEGTVIEFSNNGEYNGGMGNYVYIRHDNQFVSKYFHLDSVVVRKNQKVNTGEKIGTMGTTGHSTGVHLHLQIEKNGQHVNPFLFINPIC